MHESGTVEIIKIRSYWWNKNLKAVQFGPIDKKKLITISWSSLYWCIKLIQNDKLHFLKLLKTAPFRPIDKDDFIKPLVTVYFGSIDETMTITNNDDFEKFYETIKFCPVDEKVRFREIIGKGPYSSEW